MTYYDLKDCESLIDEMLEKGCEVNTIEEGCLGLGKVVIDGGDKFYSFVITEVYLNDSSSTHKMRRYRKLPKKYKF